MATYVLIPGAASSPWHWHLLDARLRERGHDVVAVDLPVDQDGAGLSEYADVVVETLRDRDVVAERGELVLVAHSFAGFTAPWSANECPWTCWCCSTP
ncbi:alpha/beta fold hydrolase [Actinokineospora sp. 24-640]